MTMLGAHDKVKSVPTCHSYLRSYKDESRVCSATPGQTYNHVSVFPVHPSRLSGNGHLIYHNSLIIPQLPNGLSINVCDNSSSSLVSFRDIFLSSIWMFFWFHFFHTCSYSRACSVFFFHVEIFTFVVSLASPQMHSLSWMCLPVVYRFFSMKTIHSII